MNSSTRPAMRLSELLGSEAGQYGDIEVSGLGLDSRAIQPGDAFIALRGSRGHGITFAPAALARGASVVLAEPPAPAAPSSNEPLVWVDQLRERAGEIAARFHRDPSAHVCVIGVTGTNGKTSTVQFLAQALSELGATAASIGTLGTGMYGHLRSAERTTPDALSVQALLAQFRQAAATHVAMEVSSHALEQGRVNAVHFDVAVFTNLSRDHLDYHGDMHAYAAAKAKLFAFPQLSHAIVSIDDEFGAALLRDLPPVLPRLSTGLDENADVRAKSIELDRNGLRFDLATPWGSARIASPLLGKFNVHNLLGVVATLGALGFAFDAIAATVGRLRPVAGRMNRLGGDGRDPLVVVDYAHTPDALKQALGSLRAHCAGRLICVFGCGGERDQGKRPQMGAIAERGADQAIVTDDNPRHEDPDAIVAQIVAGMEHPERVRIERNRSRAIALALQLATADDVVLVAGKGHEPYQDIGAQRLPFDDHDVARELLEARAC